MGRYYDGDIEGKFWFGVQSSDDASYFGGNEEVEKDEDGIPLEISYSFTKEDLDDIDSGLSDCKEKLAGYHHSLSEFFEANHGYNDDMLSKYLGVTKMEVRDLLEWYARYTLGNKIKNCVVEKGQCNFTCET